MAARRQPIYELELKLTGLQELMGCPYNFDKFCKKIGIGREGLRVCITDTGTRGLNVEYQDTLASSIGFSRTWPEWIETDQARIKLGTRRDTAEKFLDRCRREIFAEKADVEDKPTPARQTNVALKSVRKAPPAFCDDQLATVELQASQSGPGEAWPISLDLICNPSVIAGVEIAVKRGRLKLDCGAAQPDTKSNIAYPCGHVIERLSGNVRLTLGGTSQLPSWEVQAENGHIGIVSLPFDFCMVHDLAAGDVIGVRFLAYLMDLEEVDGDEEDETDDTSPDGDSVSFLRVGYKKLGPAKQKILKRLSQMQLTGGETGRAVLAADELHFELAYVGAAENADVE